MKKPIFTLTLLFLSLAATGVVLAQTLSLSVSPPIVEVMIMPGKEVVQTFSIGNASWDGYAVFSLSPFFPKDEYGNISVDDSYNLASSPTFANWFTLPEKTFLRAGEVKNVALKISPPESAPEKDYYFTLFYELDNQSLINAGQTTGNISQAKIGANILISVSKDGKPAKKATIADFNAPKIIDSLQKISYFTKIENAGQFLFKPTGTIEIKPLWGKSEILKLAPVNIITSSTRVVPCLKEEALVDCRTEKKVLLGLYRSQLSFKTDGEGETYTAQTTTVALPFTLIFAVLTIVLVYSLLKKGVRRTDT